MLNLQVLTHAASRHAVVHGNRNINVGQTNRVKTTPQILRYLNVVGRQLMRDCGLPRNTIDATDRVLSWSVEQVQLDASSGGGLSIFADGQANDKGGPTTD